MRWRARVLTAAAGLVVAAVGLPAVPATADEALLACAVSPRASGGGYPANSSYCFNDRAPSGGGYIAGFGVLNRPADAVDYTWSITDQYGMPRNAAACTGYSSCQIPVSTAPNEYVGTVSYTSGGVTRTLQAHAFVEPWCGSAPC